MLCSELWRGVLSLFDPTDAQPAFVTVSVCTEGTSSDSTNESESESATHVETAEGANITQTGNVDSEGTKSSTSSSEKKTTTEVDTKAAIELLRRRFPGSLGVAVSSLYSLARMHSPDKCRALMLPLSEGSIFPLPDRFYSVTVYLVGYLLGGESRLHDLYMSEQSAIVCELPSVVESVIDRY